MIKFYNLKKESVYYCTKCGRKLKYNKEALKYNYLTGQPCRWEYSYSCPNKDCDVYKTALLVSNKNY